MMETIKEQTYKNIVTIVHTDDPRDTYVTGDIIVKGSSYGANYGNAPYNLYNNRLLSAIPEGEGWYHFIDDDDEYAAPDVIERMVSLAKRDHVNVCRVVRWNGIVFPKPWKGNRKTFQTECFFLHTDHKRKGTWWSHKGGDHNYSKQLTRVLPCNWIEDLTICRAQEGKGHGNKLDAGGKVIDKSESFKSDKKVIVRGLRQFKQGPKQNHIRQDHYHRLDYDLAYKLEQAGYVKVTFPDFATEKKPVMANNLFKF